MSEAQTVQLSYDDGARAVELAREAVESYVRHGQREHPGSMRDAFYARTGAFVRIRSTRGRGQLRGCAGAYRTDDQLGHAIVDAAIQAASGDSAGSEIGGKELSDLSISVCVVSNTLLTNDPPRISNLAPTALPSTPATTTRGCIRHSQSSKTGVRKSISPWCVKRRMSPRLPGRMMTRCSPFSKVKSSASARMAVVSNRSD